MNKMDVLIDRVKRIWKNDVAYEIKTRNEAIPL